MVYFSRPQWLNIHICRIYLYMCSNQPFTRFQSESSECLFKNLFSCDLWLSEYLISSAGHLLSIITQGKICFSHFTLLEWNVKNCFVRTNKNSEKKYVVKFRGPRFRIPSYLLIIGLYSNFEFNNVQFRFT